MKLLSFGEILWDVYPSEKHIGGAPLNFAVHFAKQGGASYLLSSVGDDELGKSAVDMLRGWGIKTEYISVSKTEETGKCVVTLDAKGIPSYRLLDHVAYDNITKPDFSNRNFDAFYFGTLALRSAINRKTVSEIIKECAFKEIFVDINIRKPFVSKEAVKLAFQNATVIKISEEELPVVTGLLFDAECDFINAAKAMGKNFKNIKTVIITLGEKGSFAYDCKRDVPFFCDAEKVTVVSTVGAGDSFSAAFLYQYLCGFATNECLKAASKVSAFVVARAEAIPDDSATSISPVSLKK